MLLEVAAELISFVIFVVLACGFGYLGLVLEDIGLTSLLSGNTVLGLWYLYMGSLALFVAIYQIGFREPPHRVSAIRTELAQEEPPLRWISWHS